jgi:hypothetical protein
MHDWPARFVRLRSVAVFAQASSRRWLVGSVELDCDTADDGPGVLPPHWKHSACDGLFIAKEAG